ncbi:MAG: cysteine desulfurase [Citrobacter freundii]|nr:MAG: cysteine desulfurase [Citrobacter freundii]
MSQTIYFDNAATTQLDRQVLEAMLPYLTDNYGNPSSQYSLGRITRIAIESARKKVAKLLNVKPNTIYFTSGGSESNNTAILAAIRDLGCTHIITSPIEHHAVLHAVESVSGERKIGLSYVTLDEYGEVDYSSLEALLQSNSGTGYRCFVSLMHANNETGVLLDINRVGQLCKKYNAIFHSDCVQTVGHFPLDLLESQVHFISGAAHKFHGPKGTGILYVREDIRIKPLIHGGAQERNLRAGTENVAGIVGFAKALEMAMQGFEKERAHIEELRNYMKQQLMAYIPGVRFLTPETSLYTVLSVCFPRSDKSQSLILELDMAGICVSGGSACSSGDESGSHVVRALGKNNTCTTIRFSFCKYNTRQEVDAVMDAIQSILALNPGIASINGKAWD